MTPELKAVLLELMNQSAINLHITQDVLMCDGTDAGKYKVLQWIETEIVARQELAKKIGALA